MRQNFTKRVRVLTGGRGRGRCVAMVTGRGRLVTGRGRLVTDDGLFTLLILPKKD